METKEFLINAGQLTAAIKTLKPFISKEETRYYLNGIYFEIVDGADVMNMVACDGHKLCVLQVEVDREEHFDSSLGVIVPTKALETIMAMLKGIQPDFPVQLVFTEETHRLWLDAGDEKGEFKCVDAEYPDYRKVIPNYKPDFSIGLGKAQAKEAMAALASSKEKEGMMWELKDGESPVTIRDEHKTIVVMPMRVTLPGEKPITPKPKNYDPNQTDLEEHLGGAA